jgi:hypothetical protein
VERYQEGAVMGERRGGIDMVLCCAVLRGTMHEPLTRRRRQGVQPWRSSR